MHKTGSVEACKFCNKEFYVPLWKSRLGQGKFCSRGCADRGKGPNNGCFQKGHAQLTFKNPDNWELVVCVCGKSFRANKKSRRQYCSRTCSYGNRKSWGTHSEDTKRKIGVANKKFYSKYPEKHSNWKGGVTKNPGYKSLMKKKSWFGTLGSHTNAEWNLVKEKYGFTCPSCFREEPEIKLTQDHIVPLTKGGSDYIDNIQPLCGPCNTRKMTRIIKYAVA